MSIADVIIKMFDEHVEFVNPGDLFGKLKLEALYTDLYRASHRNKLLAEAFYLTGEVEKYGTGFIRIRNLLKGDYPNTDIVLESDSGVFRVSVGNKTSRAAPETAPENTRDRIVMLLRENPRLTKQDLMDQLHKASGTIKEHFRILKKEGRIKRVGPDKGGHWEGIETRCLIRVCWRISLTDFSHEFHEFARMVKREKICHEFFCSMLACRVHEWLTDRGGT